MQNQNYDACNNPITQTKDLRSMFQHHGNQCLKFHFISFLNPEERTKMRGTCKMIKQNIPQPQYSYFETKYGGGGKARIEKNTGFVDTRGNPRRGGDSSAVRSELQSDVKTIISTYGAFAALKKTGKVITWGVPVYGGDSSSVILDLQSDVKSIFSNVGAFAALKKNGKVITWGDYFYGGDSSNVSEFLQNGVIYIEVVDDEKFRATKSDGTQIQWP